MKLLTLFMLCILISGCTASTIQNNIHVTVCLQCAPMSR
ncbi:putative lipoprotein [Acinetobacter baumannii UH9907]|uniref:Lipoprotein n=2 Tax=Acinetobacter baumannii TaxID=470 RepID=A0ABC9UYI5_ACIBA|nr:hypothetical protein ACINIS143_3073 [Acinetobacter baumannii IS-143]EKP43765.1 hypothetical protein ACIN5111_0708 [Acinetobacter baumannii OIFC111]EKP67332.1 hypothetical protein ACIN5035_2897 [Acinetobacter baumannii OIFC035]EKU65157.1 hypothetical protein ACINNAV113_2894 [Acinetobacter baumannii Naval-113]ETP87295.1 putative lipoprotein [Acinetobacter baumannii UH1007]ETQ13295.1 putative lipoprotein [Acinetobacter baumannii UH12308]ETQ26267.1 putative lipoprotein [Acinetobacter baumannii